MGRSHRDALYYGGTTLHVARQLDADAVLSRLWPLLGYGYWAVRDKRTGRYMGDIGFADFYRELDTDISQYPEAGWVFAPWAQGQGYAGEALDAILSWLKNVRGINECVCIISPDNQPSVNLAERHGFRQKEILGMDYKSVILYHLTID